MISRRKIRIKVMQALYVARLSKDDLSQVNENEISKLIISNILECKNSTLGLIWMIVRIFNYSTIEINHQKSKHLQFEDTVNNKLTRLTQNSIIQKILQNPSYKVVAEIKQLLNIDDEFIKIFFRKFIEEKEVIEYINTENPTVKDDQKVIKILLERILIQDELFEDKMEELFTQWYDDDLESYNIVFKLLEKNFEGINFETMKFKEFEQFGEDLAKTVVNKKEYCHELVLPKLKNWEADRIAKLDMILLYMGICEFLYFPTIPFKVTINECLDIAKQYSTDQSKVFINAILDSIKNDLTEQNLITKTSNI